nr:AlNc14C452G11738 [Albugo laibachii Nc14]|eukprot:CCA27076.1 AlNc14C452G11738 [Albugo laibachii Nc14]
MPKYRVAVARLIKSCKKLSHLRAGFYEYTLNHPSPFSATSTLADYIFQITTMPSRPKENGNLTFEQKKKTCLWNEANAALTQLQLTARAILEFNLVKAPLQGPISGILRDHKKYILVKEADHKCK